MADKEKPAGKRKKSAEEMAEPIVESRGPAPADEATAAPPPAEAAPAQQSQQAQPQQQQTTISTSRGFADFLATNRLSLASPPIRPGS